MMMFTNILLISIICVLHISAKDERVTELSERFLQFRFTNAAEYAAKFRYPVDVEKENYDVSELTDSHDQFMIESARKFLKEANAFKDLKLGHEDRTTISILIDVLQTYITGSEFKDYGQFTTIRTYFEEVLRVISWMPKKTKDQMDYVIKRMLLQSANFGKIKKRLLKSVAKNITDHKIAVLINIKDLTNEVNCIETNFNTSKFAQEFLKFPKDIQDDSRMLFNAALLAMKTEMQMLRNYLQKEYLPKTREHEGVWSLPRGDEYYRACLKWHLSIEINETSAQSIHDLGIQQVKLTEDKMIQMIKDEQPNGNLKEFQKKVFNNPENFYANADELRVDIEAKLKNVHSKLNRVFRTVSNEKFILKFENKTGGSGAFYTDPSLDGSRPGAYNLNIRGLDKQPKFEFPTLNLHETEPGHHSQSVTVKVTDAPVFRKLIEYRNYARIPFNWPFYTAITEGWALYAESLGDELDAYNDKYAKFGHLASDVFRCARLVVDTGIHFKRWTRKQAIDYMLKHTFMSLDSISSEVDRYITTPGQACAYKIGDLHIRGLLSTAKKQIGTEFDKRDFHDMLLRLGSASLKQLDFETEHFIKIQKTKYSNAPITSMSILLIIAAVLFHYI